jgi:hypothetical protein
MDDVGGQVVLVGLGKEVGCFRFQRQDLSKALGDLRHFHYAQEALVVHLLAVGVCGVAALDKFKNYVD